VISRIHRNTRSDSLGYNGDGIGYVAYNAYSMAVLNIRNLPDEIRDRLRIRAARAGRSMEAEARAILTQSCLEDRPTESGSGLQDWVDELFGDNKPAGVVDDLIAERRREAATE